MSFITHFWTDSFVSHHRVYNHYDTRTLLMCDDKKTIQDLAISEFDFNHRRTARPVPKKRLSKS